MAHADIEQACRLLRGNSHSSNWLYENWWSGIPGRLVTEVPKAETHSPFNARRIFSAGEQAIFSSGFQPFLLEPGEYYFVEAERVMVHRLQQWPETSWFWMQGVENRTYPEDPQFLRFYVPTQDEDSIKFVSRLANVLDLAKVPFKLKTRLAEGEFHDQTVIWIQRKHLRVAIRAVSDSLTGSLIGPPPGSFSCNGVGITDHPSNGDSFGWKLCQSIWLSERLAGFGSLESEFHKSGLNPELPWSLSEFADSNWWESLHGI